MEARILPEAFEPTYWNVVFHPARSRLARLLLGRFDHVSAFAYIPGFKVWVLYDAQWGGTRISFVSHGTLLLPLIRDCIIVKFDRLYQPMIWASRIAFFCVPAIKHLLGIDSFAMRPDALFKDCLRLGGTIIAGQSEAESRRKSMADTKSRSHPSESARAFAENEKS